MASDSAWEAGWNLGGKFAQERYAHKQALSDAQFKEKHDEIQSKINNLTSKIPNLEVNSPDFYKAQDELSQALLDRDAHWRSLEHPSAIMRFGKMLGKDLHFTKKESPDSDSVAPSTKVQPTMQVPGSEESTVSLPSTPDYTKYDIVNGHIVPTTVSGVEGTDVTIPGVAAGKTIPTGPAQTVKTLTPAQVRAYKEADELIASGPLTPEQQAGADASKINAERDATITWLKKNKAPQEIIDQYIAHSAGVTGKEPSDATKQKANTKPDIQSLTLKDGTQISAQWMPDASLPQGGKWGYLNGEDIDESLLAGAKVTPKPTKPSTSKFSINVDSYKKLHNIPMEQSLTPDQLNFVEQQIALSSTAPSTNITTSLKQDVNGMWVPVTEANRRIPGFGTILHDPLGPVQSSPNSSTSTPKTSKPKGETKPSSSTEKGNTKVGPPLFQGRTSEISAAQKDVIAATKVDSLAKQALASHEAVQQRQLALGMIRGMAGRVNMQEFEQYTKKMGVENTVEGLIMGIESGQLPPGIVQQLANAAHANLKASQEALKAALTPMATSDATPQGGGGKPKHYVGERVQTKDGPLVISVVHPDGSFE